MKKPLNLLLIFFLVQYQLLAQEQHKIDSLQNELKNQAAKRSEFGRKVPLLFDTSTVNILSGLSAAYWGNDPDKAMEYAKQTLALSEQIGFKKGMGYAYSSMGVVNSDKGKYLPAMEFYNKALKISRETNDKKNSAIAYNNIGMVYHNQGNYPEALKHYYASLKIQEEMGSKKGISIAYNNMGSVYHRMGNFPQALKSYFAALKVNTEMGRKKGISFNYNNIGDVYREQGKKSEALKYYIASLKVKEEIGDMQGIGGAFNNIGIVYNELGNYPDALRSQFAALKIQEEISDMPAISATYSNIGNIYLNQKKFKEARQYLSKSLSLAKEHGILEIINESYDLITKLDSMQGDYKRAFENYKMFISTRDSLNNEENTTKATQIQMKHEFEKKETAINAEHEKKEALANAEIMQQKFNRNILIGGIFVLGLILFLLFNRFQLRKKIESQQAIIDERVRISRELHDDVGAQLSTTKLFLHDLKKNFGNEKGQEMLDNSLALLDTSIRDLRVVMDELRQSTLKEKGYIAATEELVKMISHRHGIKFELSHHGINERLLPQTEHHLYRITQELINNTLKYAQAKKVSIDLVRQAEKIVLTYEDDGIGFDPAKIQKGYGLVNMESRLQSIDGHLEINTAVGKGFMAVLEIPYQRVT